MFIEGLSTLRVNTITPGPYFSDHCAIELSVSVPKPKIERKNVKFRKTAEIDPVSFVSDLDLTSLESEEDLNILLVRYSRELRRVLDIHAPEIERKITTGIRIHGSNQNFMIKKGKYDKENVSGGNTINNINGKH